VVIEEKVSVLSRFMAIIEYSAWGAGAFLLVWGGIHHKNGPKWKRIWIAFVWIFVIMSAASTLDVFYGQTVYSGKQRSALLVGFLLLFVSASLMTYRSFRRSLDKEEGQAKGGPGLYPQ